MTPFNSSIENIFTSENYYYWQIIEEALSFGKIPQCPQNMSVDNWFKYIKEQGIAGLLFSRLQKLDTFNEQNVLYNLLKQQYAVERFIVDLRDKETINVLRFCANQNGCVILLKGISLQHFLYGKEEIRLGSDIDILINDGSLFTDTSEFLLKTGYRKFIYYNTLYERRFMKSVTFLPNRDNLHFEIDLHKQIIYSLVDKRCALNQLFMKKENFQEKELNGYKIKVMKNEPLFAFLTYHLFNVHSYIYKFSQLYDLILLSEKIDCTNIAYNELVRNAEMENVVAYVNELIYAIKNKKPYCNFPFGPMKRSKRKREMMSKLKNIRYFWNKMIWLLCVFFPSEKFLKNRYKECYNTTFIRVVHLYNKLTKSDCCRKG